MLDTLINGFKSAKLRLSGQVELNENNLLDAISTVKMSLLEADVDYDVTNKFLNNVKEKVLGEIVSYKVKHDGRKIEVTAQDHFIKICLDELVSLMGPVDTSINFNDFKPTVIMLVGLQGAGKTTTAGKLANYLREKGKKPLLVAADIYRPAAVEQLQIVGQKLDIPVYHEENKSPVEICLNSLRFAVNEKLNTVILDTAGRLAINEELMAELENIKDKVNTDEIFLVLDSMIGQDAVRSASLFEKRLNLSGFIFTKLDGDTRGGAAISIKEVTGKPIKFIGMGESFDRFEEFRPDGLASRILGFGDVVGLMKDFERVIDEKSAEEEADRILKGQFTLVDFLSQIKTLKKMGPLQDVADKMPFLAEMIPDGATFDDKELVRIEAIINSMTTEEKIRPDIINNSRLERISQGSGRPVKDIRELLTKFFQMRKMFGRMSKGMGFLSKIPGLRNLAKLGNMGDFNPEDFRNQNMEKDGKKQIPLSKTERKKIKDKRKKAKKDRKKGRR